MRRCLLSLCTRSGCGVAAQPSRISGFCSARIERFDKYSGVIVVDDMAGMGALVFAHCGWQKSTAVLARPALRENQAAMLAASSIVRPGFLLDYD